MFENLGKNSINQSEFTNLATEFVSQAEIIEIFFKIGSPEMDLDKFEQALRMVAETAEIPFETI